jgi:hypothetical protein
MATRLPGHQDDASSLVTATGMPPHWEISPSQDGRLQPGVESSVGVRGECAAACEKSDAARMDPWDGVS